MARFWGKSVPERSFVRPKKHIFSRDFLTKPAPYHFSGPNWLYGAFGAKFFRTKTLPNFASKAPSNSFFQKTRFRFEFLYKIAPHQFSWPNGLDGVIGAKSVSEWSFALPKKQVFSRDFLMTSAPYLFSGPNWLYGAFGGKIVPDENFAQFCL